MVSKEQMLIKEKNRALIKGCDEVKVMYTNRLNDTQKTSLTDNLKEKKTN